MREILFRGKAKDGKWYFGDLVQFKSGFVYIQSKEDGKSNYVIPDTIGQYTGIKDRKGVKIFEGDCIGCRYNVVEYMDGTFTINGDRPLSWMTDIKDFIVVGNIHDK